jgi:PAS domain S-box-containing protein
LTKKNVKNKSFTEIHHHSDTQSNEAGYRALFESFPDGIFVFSAENMLVDVNQIACEMLGYSRNELLGFSASEIIFEDQAPSISSTKGATHVNIRLPSKCQLKHKDGAVFTAEISVTLLPDGNVLKLIRDINLLKQNAQEINQLSRLYNALTKVNQAILWFPSQEELFKKICEILVNEGGFHMAWVGWNNPDTHQLEPVASSGDVDRYLEKAKIYSDERPHGQGPSGITFRTGEAYICNDMLEDLVTLPWRDEILRRGFRSSAVFPIRKFNHILGTLSVYSTKAMYFQKNEVSLLKEAANNISFALENIAREDERKRAESIAHNEKLFSDMMLESMPGILYFYDHEGKFLRWNQNFSVASGYSDNEIAQMQPLDFFEESERASVAERISEVFVSGHAFVEANLYTKDKRKLPYFFTGRNVNYNNQQCLVGMGIDISERKHIETKLNESEQKYRELVESANSIILRWNDKGCITFMNQFGQQFFGYSHQEIIGKHVIGTIVPFTDSAGRDLQDMMQQICFDTKKFEQNINENMRRNGEHVWIAWTNKVVLDSEGRLVEILSIGTDITERLNAEKEIKALNANLEQRVAERTEELHTAMIRAEAADKIKSAFLATMSHELRTPLNSIIGFTGIVLQGMAGPLNVEQTKQLGMVRSSAKHLLALINDVLDISKIEAGQLEVRAEPFDLNAVIEKVLGLLKPVAEKKGLVLNTIINKDLGEMVSDERRLSQILINLLNNAIKFTEKGSVTLTVQLLPSDEHPSNQAVKIIITDTGVGIKHEEIKHLFQPFHQIDSGLTRLHEGTGLGLAICKKLLDLMGGQITVASEWSKGTEFMVKLPLRVVHKS